MRASNYRGFEWKKIGVLDRWSLLGGGFLQDASYMEVPLQNIFC